MDYTDFHPDYDITFEPGHFGKTAVIITSKDGLRAASTSFFPSEIAAGELDLYITRTINERTI